MAIGIYGILCRLHVQTVRLCSYFVAPSRLGRLLSGAVRPPALLVPAPLLSCCWTNAVLARAEPWTNATTHCARRCYATYVGDIQLELRGVHAERG